MKTIGNYRGVDRELLAKSAEQVRERVVGTVEKLDLAVQAGLPPTADQGRAGRKAGDEPVQKRPRFAASTPADLQAAKDLVANLKTVLSEVRYLAGTVRWSRPQDVGELDEKYVAQAMGRRELMLEDIATLEAALEAAGPVVSDLFPGVQLDAIKTAIKKDQKLLVAQKGEAAKIAEARRERFDKIMEERRARGSGPSVEKKGGGFFSGLWSREPKPIPEPVALTLDKLGTSEAVAGALAGSLQSKDVKGLITAALEKVDGPERAQLEADLKGFALLADYATESLDYRKVGVSMFGMPDNRRAHQAREYGRMAGSSDNRQAQSRQDLLQGLKAALTSEDPAGGLRQTYMQSFLHEVGVPEAAAARFEPKAEAVTQALADELFAPLRALNETMDSRYRGLDASMMFDAVREATQAVVEGRFDEWRSERPTSQAQLACLDEAGKQAWLGTEPRETKGPGGHALVTKEAEGHEVFWATKVGGPSHAFDTMSHCILSLVGNARTKAITVGDSRWHQNAARAYLRLLPDVDGQPVVYLDPTQIDFPYRGRHDDYENRAAISTAIFDHALEKAKALGAGLAVAGRYEAPIRERGLQMTALPKPLVLEPNGMVVEASDTMGRGHDWVQTDRQIIQPRIGFISADRVANA